MSGVECGPCAVVHSCCSHAREIRVEWQVRSFGFQIRERACAQVTQSRGGSGSAHQQINRLHCVGITDGAVAQTPCWVCTTFVLLREGRIPAWKTGYLTFYPDHLWKKPPTRLTHLSPWGKHKPSAPGSLLLCCRAVESVDPCPGFAQAPDLGV